MSTPIDQFFMLGAFGIANLLTGCLVLLEPAGIRTSEIQGTLAYSGQDLIYINFTVCISAALLDLADCRN